MSQIQVKKCCQPNCEKEAVEEYWLDNKLLLFCRKHRIEFALKKAMRK